MTPAQKATQIANLENGLLVNLALANNFPAIVQNLSQLTGVVGSQWSELSVRQALDEYSNKGDVNAIRYILSVPYLPGNNLSPGDAEAVNSLFNKIAPTPTYRQLRDAPIGGGAAGAASQLPSGSAGSGSSFNWSTLFTSLASNASDIISSVGNLINGQPGPTIVPGSSTNQQPVTTTPAKDNTMLYIGLGLGGIVVIGVIVWLAAKPKK